jgi:hypothetical protein
VLKCNKQMAQMTTARARRQRKAPGSYIVDGNAEDNMQMRVAREVEGRGSRRDVGVLVCGEAGFRILG